MFTEEALERFRNPKNAGELKDYNGKGKSGDPDCSDVIELYVKFKKDMVLDAKFKVFGCPGAVSTTDIFIDLIKGKTIKHAIGIKEEQISDALGGLPTSHMHCSNLPMEAFKKAVDDYKK
jgi:nitrogen fixation protein NifU and related proteins